MTKDQLTNIRARHAEGFAPRMSDAALLLAEVERLTAERDAAFARGVAAMREAAARRCEVSPIHGEKTTTARRYADAIRALPDPEDTE